MRYQYLLYTFIRFTPCNNSSLELTRTVPDGGFRKHDPLRFARTASSTSFSTPRRKGLGSLDILGGNMGENGRGAWTMSLENSNLVTRYFDFSTQHGGFWGGDGGQSAILRDWACTVYVSIVDAGTVDIRWWLL